MTVRHCLCLALAALPLAALPLAAHAAPAPPAPAPSVSLSVMLLRATPPKTGVVLAVDAAKVPLPPEAVLPGDAPTVRAVGAIYGRSVLDFGTVTAVVPPTLTVVYAPPETPNPYDGMPPGQVMSLLAKTFTPAQWKAFLSPAGVAYTTMTGDTQAALFGALFPDGHLKVIQDNPTGENDPKTKQDLSGDTLTAAHLRLGYMVMIALPKESDPTTQVFAAGLRPANSPPRYFMTNAQDYNVDHELGATVRESVPNTLKAGQMALDAPALKAAVPLSGIKTVDDLITRIGVTTKRELYADARYGTRPITLLPANGSARSMGVRSPHSLQTTYKWFGRSPRRGASSIIRGSPLPACGARHSSNRRSASLSVLIRSAVPTLCATGIIHLQKSLSQRLVQTVDNATLRVEVRLYHRIKTVIF